SAAASRSSGRAALPAAEHVEQPGLRLGLDALRRQVPDDVERLAELRQVGAALVAVVDVRLEADALRGAHRALEVLRHELDELLARHIGNGTGWHDALSREPPIRCTPRRAAVDQSAAK